MERAAKLAALIALWSVLAAGEAAAQLSRDTDIETGLGPERGSDVRTGSRPGFTADLTAPFLYSTNPVLESSDIAQGNKPDWHFNPDLLLRWSHQFASFKLAAATDVSVDRFLASSDADLDTVFGSLRLALTDGSSSRFVPYVSYTATTDFEPTFGNPDDVLHDFAVGLSHAIGFDAGGKAIPYADTTAPGSTSLALDLKAARRLADPKDFENWFVIVKLDFDYVFTKEWAIELTPKLRFRWYDDFEGAFRRDYKPSVLLKTVWTPDWLTRLNSRAEIDLSVSFEKNYSTLPQARFTDWEVGPTLALGWKF